MILPSLAKSGPGIQVESLCKEFLKKKYVVEVFYIRETDNVSLEFYGIKKTKLHFNKGVVDSFRTFDIIHSNGFLPRSDRVTHRKLFKQYCSLYYHA